MLSRILIIIAGMCLATGLSYAQNNPPKSSNPYLAEMQQKLDKANAKALAEFNKQFPQPTPSTIDTNTKGATTSSSPPKMPTQQNPPPVVTTSQAPDIAVTTEKKDEKKDDVVNIFGTPGASTSSTTTGTNETNDQNQNTPNIFR